MNILSWNCREIGSAEKVRALKGLVRKHELYCLFLIETKCSTQNIEKLCKKLKYLNYFVVDALGNAGGLAFIWLDEVNIQCSWKTNHIICCEFLGDENITVWRCFALYGPLYLGEKSAFWEDLWKEVTSYTNLWLLVGDLNEYMDESEKKEVGLYGENIYS